MALGENPNYNINPETDVQGGTFSITPAEIKIAADGKTKVYDNDEATDPVLTATVGGTVGGDELNYTLSREPGQDAKSYVITVALGENPNYAVTPTDGTFTITPKSIVDPDDPDFGSDFEVTGPTDTVYNGLEQRQPVTVSDKETGDDVTVSLAYSGDLVNVGEPISVVITASGNYTGSVTKTYRITPATLTVTTPDASKVYDGTALTTEGTIAGFVNGETATFATTGAQTEVGSSQNTYSLTWDGTALESNYTVVEELGTLEVTPVMYALTVTYVMADGTTAPAAVTEQHPAGEAYNITLPVVAGYDATDDAGNAISALVGQMPAQNLVITITYAAQPAPTPTPTPTPTPADTPAAPAAVVPVTPAADTPAAPAATVTIDEDGTPLVEAIDDDANALGSGEGVGTWSLFDVVMTVLTALLSLIMLAGVFGRKTTEDMDDNSTAAPAMA